MGKSIRFLALDCAALMLLTVPFLPFVWNTSWGEMLRRLYEPAVEAPPPAEIPTPEQYTPVFPPPPPERTIFR